MSPWSRAMLSYEPRMFWIFYSRSPFLELSVLKILTDFRKPVETGRDPCLYRGHIPIIKLLTSKHLSFIIRKKADLSSVVSVNASLCYWGGLGKSELRWYKASGVVLGLFFSS